MHLLYIDESGNLSNHAAEHVTVGGIAVHERVLRELRQRVDGIIAEHLDAHLRGLEIHAQHMNRGKGSWRSIPVGVRRGLLEGLADLMVEVHERDPSNVSLFAVARSPGAVPRADALERIFEELLMRFHSFVERWPGRELGMVIADEAKHERVLQGYVDGWRQQGTRSGRLVRLAEVPLFADSTATRLLQLADVVAYGVNLAYERGDSWLLDRLIRGFQAGGNGKIHSLAHLTPTLLDCECHACISRRSESPPTSPLDLTYTDDGTPHTDLTE